MPGEIVKTQDKQLELGLKGSGRCRTANLRARRRAGWWFERIRQVVDDADEPKSNQAARQDISESAKNRG